jgi:hypothetical protein
MADGVTGLFGAAPPLLDGVGTSLLNLPLQEQLRLMQEAQLLQPGQLATPEPTPRGAGGSKGKSKSKNKSKAGDDGSAGKPLSSRYRGVCWNRKNKRWQAAINCGGASSRPALTVVSPGPHRPLLPFANHHPGLPHRPPLPAALPV